MKNADSTVPIAAIQIVARWVLFREAIPAEDPEAQERRLEEERQQPLDGQRRTEDVADEPAVVAPVHAELELLHDAGDHADGEVDQEQLPVEAREPQVPLIPRSDPGRLEAGDEECQPDRQRDEQEVVDGRDAELPSRQVKGTHAALPSSSTVKPSFAWDRGCSAGGLPRARGKRPDCGHDRSCRYCAPTSRPFHGAAEPIPGRNHAGRRAPGTGHGRRAPGGAHALVVRPARAASPAGRPPGDCVLRACAGCSRCGCAR